MGRQIRFFATPTDYRELLESAFSKKCFVLDREAKKTSFECISNESQKRLYVVDPQLYIATEKSNIIMYSERGGINPIFSDVIEVANCHLSYDSFLKRKEMLKSADNILSFCISDDATQNRYEHGRLWYETSYYDNDDTLVRKNNDIEKVYSSLVREIRKKSKKSNNGSFYILPNAYKLYKNNMFIPCSGKFDIIFD